MEKNGCKKMSLGHFSYLFYMLIFTLIPIAILWLKEFNFLIKNIKIIFTGIIIAIVYTIISSYFAQRLHAWFFNEDKILGIYILNFPVEDVIFAVLISITIASAVLVFINYQESGKIKRIISKL